MGFISLIPMHKNLEICGDLFKHGEGMHKAWYELSYQDPPDDFFGRLLWTFGILGQLVLSIFTFPAGLACFLLEETTQTAGMGAYLLASAGMYDELLDYLPKYRSTINSSLVGAKNLATLSPIIGGASIMYLEAAKISYNAFGQIAERKVLEQAEKDEALRQKLLHEAMYGTVHLSSSPSSAEIWINNVNTEKLTPETIKDLPSGTHTFEVRKYSASREAWDIFVFDVEIEAGRKKEILARIPPGITSPDEDTPTPGTTQIRLTSSPTNAEIYINNVDTALLTPEVFKNLEPGTYALKLRSFSKRRDMWDEYSFDVTLEEDKKYEYKINIPAGTKTEEDPSGDTDEDENPQLPEFMKAQVTGDYAIDGDTFVSTTGERIRILGIDAPEMGQKYSQEAKDMLHDMIAGKTVYLKIQVAVPLDQYGRTLAITTTSRGNHAYLILIEGLATVFIASDATYDPTYYYTAENLAKERKVGIWTALP